MVAAGLAPRPFDAPGLNAFKGRVVTHYEGNTSFQNERVVVVGAGETASGRRPDVPDGARRPRGHAVADVLAGRHAPSSLPIIWRCGSCSCCRAVRLVVFELPLTTWLLGCLTGIDPPGADTFSLKFLDSI